MNERKKKQNQLNTNFGNYISICLPHLPMEWAYHWANHVILIVILIVVELNVIMLLLDRICLI